MKTYIIAVKSNKSTSKKEIEQNLVRDFKNFDELNGFVMGYFFNQGTIYTTEQFEDFLASSLNVNNYHYFFVETDK